MRQDHDPVRILGDRIDLAFLDRLHLCETLLRDFIDTERFCNSVVVLHDCFPPDAAWTSRTRPPDAAWSGDVWKIPIILRKHRPDFGIYPSDWAPSELMTNLNSRRSVLTSRYDDIFAEFRDLDLFALEAGAFAEIFQTISTDRFDTPEKLSQLVWL